MSHLAVGDRVVIPFNISCGHCYMCDPACSRSARPPRCREQGTGAALFGYTKLYGQVPGGQAEFLRVPQAHFGPIKVPEGPPDDRFLFLSDVLPTAWQAVEYADVPDGGSVAVLGLGPIGQMAAASPATTAPTRVSASTWCPSAGDGRARTASRRSTSTTATTTSPRSLRDADRRARSRRA